MRPACEYPGTPPPHHPHDDTIAATLRSNVLELTFRQGGARPYCKEPDNAGCYWKDLCWEARRDDTCQLLLPPAPARKEKSSAASFSAALFALLDKSRFVRVRQVTVADFHEHRIHATTFQTFLMRRRTRGSPLGKYDCICMYSTYRAATVPVFLRIVDIILLQDGVTQHWKGQQPPIHWPLL
jgi:hypothetical protein